MGRKNQSEDKYFKKQRRKKLWHRLLLAAGSIVVFITTYMLILPAITAEVGSIELFDESLSSGSAVTPVEDETYIIIEETTEETVEETTEIISEETTEDPSEALSEETSDQALEETTSGTSSGGTDTSGGETSEETAEAATDEVSEEITEEAAEETTEEEFVITADSMIYALLGEAGIALTSEEDGEEEEDDGSIELTLTATVSGSSYYTDTYGTEISFRGTGTNDSYNCEYDPDTGNFSVDLAIDFVMSAAILTSGNVTDYNNDTLNGSYYGVYSIDLPEGIIVPDNVLNKRYEGVISGTSTVLFDLYFEKYTDETTGATRYRVYMGFLNSQITGNEETIKGTISLEGYISSSSYSDGSVVVTVGGENVIEISPDEITYSSGETIDEDIYVKKSGSYNTTTDESGNTTSTVSYTVMVYTKKGTGETITLTDSFTTEFSSSVLSDPSSSLQSITVSTGTNTAYVYWEGKADNFNDSEFVEDTESPITLTNGTGNYTYYYDIDGNLVITLPGLSDVDGKDGQETILGSSDWRYSKEDVEVYYVTYTYKVSPQYSDSTANNTVKASTEDTTAVETITDTSSAEVTVSKKTAISKTAEYYTETDSDGNENGYIKWTIVVGDGSASLAGYTLTDTMFSSVGGIEALNYSSLYENVHVYTGSSEDDSNFVYQYYPANCFSIVDENGVLTGIKFLEDAESQYTIVYTTEASSWDQTYLSNTATLTPTESTDPDVTYTHDYGDSSLSAGTEVTVPAAGGDTLDKKIGTPELSSDGKTYTFPWTVTITIPTGGIPAGSEIEDSPSTDNHYMTYDQAKALGELVHEVFGDNTYVSVTFRNSSWQWIHIDNLDESTYYYGYKITFNKAVAYETYSQYTNLTEDNKQSLGLIDSFTYTSGDTTATASYDHYDNKVTLNYYSTGSISDSPASRTFSNTVSGGGSYKSASYTYTNNVVKYGYYQSHGTATSPYATSFTSTDGEVSWVVKVVLDTSNNCYTITDTLPTGVTLKKLQVSNSASDSNSKSTLYAETTTVDPSVETTTADPSTETTTADAGISEGETLSGIYDGDLDVSYTLGTSDNTVTVYANYGENANASSITLYLFYTCQIADDYQGENTAFNNTVKVKNTTTDKDYGSGSQTTTVYWDVSTGTETKTVSKDDYFDTNNNKIKYAITIDNDNGNPYTYTVTNEDGSTSQEYDDDMVIYDVLSYNSYPTYGLVRSASLQSDTLKVYVDDGTLTIAEDKTVSGGTELDSSQYSWTLEKVVNTGYDGTEAVVQTIKVTLPNDGRKYVLAYAYKISIITDEVWANNYTWIDNDGTDVKAHATNYAYLTVNGETKVTTDSIETTESYNFDSVSAEGSTGTGYTIYKVDKDNFALKLEGATFDLYVYNKDATPVGFEKVASITTNSKGTASISGVIKYLDTSTGTYYDQKGDNWEPYYRITDPSDSSKYIYIPINTLCYFVESEAPTDYQLDGTKYYFYYGETIATLLTSVTGHEYATDVTEAVNIILGNSEYITNGHTVDYYSEKTKISVIKSWTNNEEDPNDTYEKTDDSLNFTLYRIRKDLDGNYWPEEDDEDETSTSEGATEATTEVVTVGEIPWQVDFQWSTNVASGTVGYTENTNSLKLSLYHQYAAINESAGYIWYPGVTITDGNSNVLVEYTGSSYGEGTLVSGNGSWTGSTTSAVGGTFTATINLTDSVKEKGLIIKLTDTNNSDTEISVSFALSSASATTTTEAASEASTEEVSEVSTETTTTVLYAHVFQDDVIETTTDEQGNSEVVGHTFNNDYKDYEKITDSSENFFKFYGALTDTNGSQTYNAYKANTATLLTRSFKMQTNVDSVVGSGSTTIEFTSQLGGVLTMVFTDKTDTNAVIINSSDGTSLNKTASNYKLQCHLDAGSYTIKKSTSSYVVYISFEEGAGDTSSDGNSEILNFNDGTKANDFFTVSGSTTSSYGEVTYVNYYDTSFTSATALKMGSSSSITFESANAGTLYMVFTNPKKAASVGASIDGNEHKASITDTTTTDGEYYIYVLSTYIEAGSHTIKRIGSTEYLLYYIQFVPDDFGSGEWKELNTDITSIGKKVSTFTISYASNWRWTSESLPSQWINEETGEVLGYYEYYVVEESRYDPQDSSKQCFYTLYMNNEGIVSGSIKVSNRINPTTSGVVSLDVNKVWYQDGKQLTSPTIDDYSVSYTLYRKVVLLSSTDQDTGGTYSVNFDNNISTFFTTTGTTQSGSSTIGTGNYGGTSYSTTLAFDSTSSTAPSIAFDTLADSGVLTLVFSTYLPPDVYNSSSSYTSGTTNYVTADGTNYYAISDDSGTLNNTLYVVDSSSSSGYKEWDGSGTSITYYAFFNENLQVDEKYTSDTSWNDDDFTYTGDTDDTSKLVQIYQYTANSIDATMYRQTDANKFDRSNGNGKTYTLARTNSNSSTTDPNNFTRIRNNTLTTTVDEKTVTGDGKCINLYRSTDGGKSFVSMEGYTIDEVKDQETEINNSRAYYIKSGDSYIQTDGKFYTLQQYNTVGYAFTLTVPGETSTVYQYVYNPDTETLTITAGGSEVYSGSISDCPAAYLTSLDIDEDNNTVVFEIPLSVYTGDYSSGYKVGCVSSALCYLYYAEYFYKYNDAKTGIAVGTGTLDASNDWSEEWSSLTYPVYDAEGNGTIIGYYSYYIVETSADGETGTTYSPTYSVTMYTQALDSDLADLAETYKATLTPDENTSAGTTAYYNSDSELIYTETATTDGEGVTTYTYTASSGETISDITTYLLNLYLETLETDKDSEGNITYCNTTRDPNDNSVISSQTVLYYQVSDGNYYIVSSVNDGTSLTAATAEAAKISSFTITNTVEVQDVVLPSSGGDGGFKYILAGTLTSLGAILLLYKCRKGLSTNSR
ncbi:MAG: hypothetical protein LUC92_06700 [Clostridiales bacterium]|nr:hypothetical protein [Clostridiales bacterium]